ncbi:MAG: hypothetical protein PHN28_04840 [Aquabacterium sp.]|nr:hypothetical protein [Aquabacterium sp.]MDD2976080.1 hypothetical protein [Aquabacterium sp.]
MRLLSAALCLAQEVGAGVGRGQVLLRPLSPQPHAAHFGRVSVTVRP